MSKPACHWGHESRVALLCKCRSFLLPAPQRYTFQKRAMCEEGKNCIHAGGIYQGEEELLEIPDLHCLELSRI